MLTRPMTVNKNDDRGRGLAAVTPPPAVSLADEGDDEDEIQTGVFYPPAPPWSFSSSSLSSPSPTCTSSSSSAPSMTPPLPYSSMSTPPSVPLLPPPPPPSSRSPSVFFRPCVSPTSSSFSHFLSSSPPVPPSFLPTPPPPPFSSTSSLTVASVSLLHPAPPPSSVTPPRVAPSLHPSVPSTPPPVFFTPLTARASSSFASLSLSSPSIPPSPLPPHPPHVSSAFLISPSPPVTSPPRLSLPCSSSSTPSLLILPAFSVCSPSSRVSPLSSSSSSVHPSLHASPPSLLSLHPAHLPPLPTTPPAVSSHPLPPCSPHDSPPLPSAPAAPPLSVFTPALSSSSTNVPSSLLSPPLVCPPPVAPSLLLPPPPPPPPSCCTCSSLLPRLLSAHRLEVRRLLRGALASIGRRLDSLERRSGRKRKKKGSRRREDGGGAACSSGLATYSSTTFSCSPTHFPPVATSSSISSSSSSESEDSLKPPFSSDLSQSAQRRRRRRHRGEETGWVGRKRRRKNQRETEMTIEEDKDEEEDSGRFVGRMAISFRGGGTKEELPLTLYDFSHRKHRKREGGETSQSEKAIHVVRQNGYRAPLLLQSSRSFAQYAVDLLPSTQSGRTCSQSEALTDSLGQWRFSEHALPVSLSSNHSCFHLWVFTSLCSFSHTPMLRLSLVAVETLLQMVRGGACGSPPRPLKDWTAPPSLSIDHCYVQTFTPSLPLSARRQQKQRTSQSSRSRHLPRRRPLPPCQTSRLSSPLPVSQSAAGSEFVTASGERGKRVSQIRIRRASPRETPLTPMGLPKVKRVKKKEFSLEEIYTNKNYKSPTTNRSLETIFEEPREKDGALLLIGQQRRRRLLLFPDFTQPRKRKRPQGAGLPVTSVPRKRAAARRHCHGGGPCDDESDLDVMLVERLSALEDFLIRQGLDV